MTTNLSISSGAWAERFGTTAIIAWWILAVGGILL
jgi:hypothetical protein